MSDRDARRDRVAAVPREGQSELIAAFEALVPGSSFATRTWDRPGGGGGTARVMDGGELFERGGVNVSVVKGKDLPEEVRRKRDLPEGLDFWATGISMVLHPRNPMVPTFHANFRYFEAGDMEDWWFGGGADLTPYYPYEEDVRAFHGTLRALCDRHDVAEYPRWKAWCDDYFTVRHRNEMRGVGGIFFDWLAPTEEEGGWEAAFAFMIDGVRTLKDAYVPIVERRMGESYGDAEREWQLLRRGRYAEFNLVYDRGTRFGLQTQGDIEAILMSLPPLARWETDAHPVEGTPEHAATAFYQPQDWA